MDPLHEQEKDPKDRRRVWGLTTHGNIVCNEGVSEYSAPYGAAPPGAVTMAAWTNKYTIHIPSSPAEELVMLAAKDAKVLAVALQEKKDAENRAAADEALQNWDNLSDEEKAAALANMSEEEKAMMLQKMAAEEAAKDALDNWDNLTDEEKALALAAMSPEERAAMMNNMSDEERAAALSNMSDEEREAALKALTESLDPAEAARIEKNLQEEAEKLAAEKEAEKALKEKLRREKEGRILAALAAGEFDPRMLGEMTDEERRQFLLGLSEEERQRLLNPPGDWLLDLSPEEQNFILAMMTAEARASWVASLDRPKPYETVMRNMDPKLKAATLAAQRVLLKVATVDIPHMQPYTAGKSGDSAKDQLRALRARVGHLESFLTKQNSSLKEIEGVVKMKHREVKLFEEDKWKIQPQ